MNGRFLLSSLPNLITLARLLAVPVMVWLIVSGEWTAAFWLFVAAGVSDGIDGYIAKRFDAESVLGSYLDPIADKVMLVCVFVTLGIADEIGAWLVIIIVSRDALIVGGTLLSQIVERPIKMKPLFVSKINTVAQIVLAAVALANLGLGWSDIGQVMALEYTVAATTLASGALYLVQWLTGSGEFIDRESDKLDGLPRRTPQEDERPK
ncbi:MAG: CDP-alcohol phosphatidyltransferase family protein [Alphaproteobacteria bacterium]|nr:CDP-alcohol phosphatidyltransferase family protein [Alphaproteobacteria bacterium]